MNVASGAMAEQFTGDTTAARVPSLAITLLTILVPVVLMLLAALVQSTMADGVIKRWVMFAGSPLMAMLLATLLALYTFGRSCGFDRDRVLQFAEESLPPIASVLLVVGAGGGFGRVLVSAGVDKAIAQVAGGFQMSPLVLGWVIAALLRLAVGSATVSVVTSASIMAPMIATHAGREQGAAGRLDRRGVADRLARQRRRLLAGEGVPQHDRPADARDLDGAGDVVSVGGLAGVLVLGQLVGVTP